MADILHLLFLPIQIYLIFNVLYVAVSAVAGKLGKGDDTPPGPPNRKRRIAVLIPAYKEDSVILDTVKANLQQTYPAHLYDLIIIADHFQADTLLQLGRYPVKVIAVAFENSTVQRSITYALNHLPRHDYDVVLISDADNHMAVDFLERIDNAFDGGWRAVQGHRVAKNTNTSVAVFDAVNEEVNNNIFRAGQRALGLSASLIGSGMAFETALLRKAMSQSRTVGGYDKELEMNLLVDGVRIAYLKEALIYDEKVQNLEVFERQRTRWIAAQVYFVRTYFQTALRQLGKGNLEPVNAFVKALLLPRTLFLATLAAGLFLSLIIGSRTMMNFFGWTLAVLLLSLLLSIPGYLWRKVSLRDFVTFPLLILRMIRSLTRFKTAKNKFLHTPHGETIISRRDAEPQRK